MNDATPVRHLLGLSGGKDSSALAIYLRDKVPEMEYPANLTKVLKEGGSLWHKGCAINCLNRHGRPALQ